VSRHFFFKLSWEQSTLFIRQSLYARFTDRKFLRRMAAYGSILYRSKEDIMSIEAVKWQTTWGDFPLLGLHYVSGSGSDEQVECGNAALSAIRDRRKCSENVWL
jgi:hypothetical protein